MDGPDLVAGLRQEVCDVPHAVQVLDVFGLALVADEPDIALATELPLLRDWGGRSRDDRYRDTGFRRDRTTGSGGHQALVGRSGTPEHEAEKTILLYVIRAVAW